MMPKCCSDEENGTENCCLNSVINTIRDRTSWFVFSRYARLTVELCSLASTSVYPEYYQQNCLPFSLLHVPGNIK